MCGASTRPPISREMTRLLEVVASRVSLRSASLGHTVVGGVDVGLRVSDGVLVGSTVLALVGGVLVAPLLRVENTVLALGVTVHVQNVSVEELAGLCGAVGGRVGKVVLGLAGAGSGAASRVEGKTVVEVLVAPALGQTIFAG